MVNKIINKILILGLMTSAFLLASCSFFSSGSSYTNYTWSSSYSDDDQDGIPDVAEKDGTTYYGMTLYDWGARTNQRDIFIHIAPMNSDPTISSGYPDGGMLLQKKALDRIVSSFASQDISVHFDVGSTGLYDCWDEITGRGTSNYNLSGDDHEVPYNDSITLSSSVDSTSGFVYVDDLKDTYFPSERNQIFYFLVIGSSQESDGSGGSSGIAWLKGREFLMTLAGWNLGFGTNSTYGITWDQFENRVVNYQAATIMHEFGHNLGLYHGGDENTNYKPNYISIMNYLYQLQGVPSIGNNEWDRYYYERLMESENYDTSTANTWYDLLNHSYDDSVYDGSASLCSFLLPIDFEDSSFTSSFNLDYSNGDGNSLNESSLTESDGLGQSSSISVDWDGDGSISSGVSENINPTDDSIMSTLDDYNDWSNLYLYYNYTSSGSARMLTDDDLEFENEYDEPIIIPIDRSRQ